MFNRILEAILAGHSTRSISAWTKPAVSHSAIHRYKSRYVDPAVANAEAFKLLTDPLYRPNNVLKPESYSTGTPVSQDLDAARQLAKSAILAAPALDIRETRLKAKMERHRRLMMIVDGRAADMEHVPGGASGFLVRDYKGSGESMTEVHKFDHELVKAFEEVEKDIAIELGQWQEGAPTGSVSIQIMVPTPGSGEAPRITFAAQSPAIESVRTIETTAKTDDEGGLEVMAVQPR